MTTSFDKLHVVLAGQANVGKSVIFNHYTGLHQHIGNWPGKTIEKAEGTLFFKGYSIDIIDLPGIYSLNTYTVEESISRDYITNQKPDFVVNVVDATNLERNLLFTLQLMELEAPLVMALNMTDLAKKKGIEIDIKELKTILDIPVTETIASRRSGLTDVLDLGIDLSRSNKTSAPLKFGKEVEARIEKLLSRFSDHDLPYPERWLAIKLLERNKEIRKLIHEKEPGLAAYAETLCEELENIHGHDSFMVIADERCHLVSRIISQTVKITRSPRTTFLEKLDLLTTHKITGYLVMISSVILILFGIIAFGNWFSALLEKPFSGLQVWWENSFGISSASLLAFAAIEGVLALILIVIPYILPFYLVLFLLEDAGYLARVALLTDSLMHKIGIHGKAAIPLSMGLGCNVPACLGCRIMETERERMITGFLTTLVPCSAVTIIIMGLVGKYVGILYALGFYVFAVLVIFFMGRLANKLMPGEATELIMPMPDYRRPDTRTTLLQIWFRLKEFIFIAAPLVILSGIIIKGIDLAGWLTGIADFLSPVTVNWLGLPEMTGILLIFGILRKELILVMLAALYGTTDFGDILTPVQMITLTLVSLLYIPCIATIAALWKEFGWKKALSISIIEILFAVAVAGLISKVLAAFF